MPYTLELSPHQTGKLVQRQHGQHLQKPGSEIGNVMHKIEENETTNNEMRLKLTSECPIIHFSTSKTII